MLLCVLLCRFIVENYNLRYLLNEVPEKDRLHPVALPAFPSTAPTGHVRRQVRNPTQRLAGRPRKSNQVPACATAACIALLTIAYSLRHRLPAACFSFNDMPASR